MVKLAFETWQQGGVAASLVPPPAQLLWANNHLCRQEGVCGLDLVLLNCHITESALAKDKRTFHYNIT